MFKCKCVNMNERCKISKIKGRNKQKQISVLYCKCIVLYCIVAASVYCTCAAWVLAHTVCIVQNLSTFSLSWCLFK